MTDLVRLRELHDAMEAEMLRDVLADAGIVAQTPGAEHRAMLGVLGSYVTIPLLVPTEDAEEAREILASLESQELVDPLPEEAASGRAGPYRSERDHGETLPEVEPRKKRVALFVGFAFPGAAQFYLRQPWLGWTLMLGAFWCLFSAADQPELGYALLVFWAFGLVDGVLGVGAFNAKGPRSRNLQLVVACVALALALGTTQLAPLPSLEELDRSVDPSYDDREPHYPY
ncbi:MAG: DUF2007 domain-containing protein [Myxococcota bacterium]